MSGKLREGYTTGACAAASAKAAVTLLLGSPPLREVDIPMPGGGRVVLPLELAETRGASAMAAVRKDAGDDPDITNGALVMASVSLENGEDVTFSAGEGVGVVTKKGLQIPPGEPAINPGPRQMITNAVREVTSKGVRVTISIPGGRELAQKTFNPRLGVEGGLSILGSTGIVRPYSHPALRESLKCALEVALAGGNEFLVFTAGNIGSKTALALLDVKPEAVVEVSNEWGFMLDTVRGKPVKALLVAGHPGKLAKLAGGYWDTHSSRSGSAVPIVSALASKTLGVSMEGHSTVEGIFETLTGAEINTVASALAERVRQAVLAKVEQKFPVAVALVDMKGRILGDSGDMGPWPKKG
ncbi:MAG: cobalamin biosynthesis protein CbiD [Nitrospinae bacterium]|nr:cobalamin biosynthesis protein CbiD [Nitrospinota bacterium]